MTDDSEVRAAADRIKRMGIEPGLAGTIAQALADSNLLLSNDLARRVAARVELGQCFLRAGWCITHNTADSMNHHFAQPESQGHSEFGIANND